MTIEVPKLDSEEIDVLLSSGEIPYLGLLTIYNELWLLDRNDYLEDISMVSRGKMATFYTISSLKSILSLFPVKVKYDNFSKKELIELIINHLFKSGRLCRLK